MTLCGAKMHKSAMKTSLIIVLLLFASVCELRVAYAVLPVPLSFKEKVEMSQPIFVGMAKKLTVSKLKPTAPPLPDLCRGIELEVEVVVSLKSGKHKLPNRITLKTVSCFPSAQEMKEGFAAMRTQLINHKQIYLVFSDEDFSIEGMDKGAEVRAMLKPSSKGERAPELENMSRKASIVEEADALELIKRHQSATGKWLN